MKPTDQHQISLHSVDFAKRLHERHRSAAVFKNMGLLSVLCSMGFMICLFVSLFANGWSAFFRSQIKLPGDLSVVGISKVKDINSASVKSFLEHTCRTKLSYTEAEIEDLLPIFSVAAPLILKKHFTSSPDIRSSPFFMPLTIAADSCVKKNKLGSLWKGKCSLSENQVRLLSGLINAKTIELNFNKYFFTHGDSQEAEIAGIYTALIGSIFTIVIALFVALPLGVGAALYLEEFAPRNRITEFVEVNINNLAAVPTIIFGLLGAAIFINILNIPRSAALAAGLTLSLIILPTIIVVVQSSLRSIPKDLRHAAQALGASQVQTVFHHILPLAFPGICSGFILALMRIMGESAPLLMLGMVAFIVNPPQGFLDPTTVLPVQIFSWARYPGAGFLENTSAATLVLLLCLLLMNSIVVILRKKFQKNDNH